MNKHLAIFTRQYLDQIFSGKKAIEARFSQKRIPPFGEVGVGDIVYLKLSGEEVKGQFTVKKVLFFEGLDEKDWEFIKKHYGSGISSGDPKTDEKFFENHKTARFATIIFIDQVEQFIVPPVNIKKRDLRGWMVL